MKKFFLSNVVTILLLIFSGDLMGQTVPNNLDQVQLMKQFLGTWKVEFSNGDLQTLDFSSFGSAMVCNTKNFHSDTVIYSFISIWGYDKYKKSIVEAEINSSDPSLLISSFVFKSANILESEKLISPDSGDSLGTRYDFKTPDLFTVTTINNNKDVATYTFKRIKK